MGGSTKYRTRLTILVTLEGVQDDVQAYEIALFNAIRQVEHKIEDDSLLYGPLTLETHTETEDIE